MLYFILTACVMDDSPMREQQYFAAFTALQCYLVTNSFTDYRIIIVEGNGQRETYLDELGCDVLYTTNNSLPTQNKGYKELSDVLAVISTYKIQNDDFVVKMTGRYVVGGDSPFMAALKGGFDCIIKYTAYLTPINHRTGDCMSGLIGMRAKYIRQIELPTENEAAEWKWAKVTYLIDEARILNLPVLGIRAHMGSVLMVNA
jgi:hypothetical protein